MPQESLGLDFGNLLKRVELVKTSTTNNAKSHVGKYDYIGSRHAVYIEEVIIKSKIKDDDDRGKMKDNVMNSAVPYHNGVISLINQIPVGNLVWGSLNIVLGHIQ